MSLSSSLSPLPSAPPLSRSQLLADLFCAYYEARRNKRNTINQLRFELKLEENLFALCDDLLNRTYCVSPSIAFIVSVPVKREVFAADFRDRVIHHLLVKYLEPLYEPYLIYDSCSCRKGKGTLFAVNRVQRFIRACSHNYTRSCYILKLDVKGYFMSINRERLYRKIIGMIEKAVQAKSAQGTPLGLDLDLVKYLLQHIIFNDPRENCIFKSPLSAWDELPPSKSLFHSAPGCGVPIGNLTSQVFSNIYLHDMDCYIRYTLGMNYYVRYVDDFIVIHEDRQRLLHLVEQLKTYLVKEVGLQLHPHKIYLQHYTVGVQFLNACLRPHRLYIRNRTKQQLQQTIRQWNVYFERLMERQPSKEKLLSCRSQLNSYLGLLIHQDTWSLRQKLVLQYLAPSIFNYFYIVNLQKMCLGNTQN
jgi:retron-type reverse transcriptase